MISEVNHLILLKPQAACGRRYVQSQMATGEAVPPLLKQAIFFRAFTIVLALTLANAALAQNIPVTDVANAAESLKKIAISKIDAEIEINARAFADAKNIHRSLVWGDWFRPVLDIAYAVYDGLTAVGGISKNSSSVRGWVKTALQSANAEVKFHSVFSSLDRLRQDGANLALAIGGPSYHAAVASMLERAETADFNYEAYQRSLMESLYGSASQSNPIRISHKTVRVDRSGGDVFNSVVEAQAYIGNQLTTISSQLRDAHLSTEQIADLSAFIDARRQDLLQSRVGNRHVTYDAYLTKDTTSVKRRVAYSLGTISQLEKWRLAVLNLFNESVHFDSISISSRFVEKINDFVLDVALDTATQMVNANLSVSAVIAGKAEINDVLKEATSLGFSIGKTDIGSLADEAQTYVSNSREQLNMIPQQMMDSLPGEISKVLLLVDDTVKYVQVILNEAESPTDTTHLLTIASSNPSNGVSVSSYVGTGSFALGTTPVNRSFIHGTMVEVTCPSTLASELVFQKWLLDGENHDFTISTTVLMNSNHTLTAVYGPTPPPTRTLSSLTIEGPASVNEDTATQYKARATYSDGSAVFVDTNLDWTANPNYATISQSGILSANDVGSDAIVTIAASYTDGGIVRTATINVTIVNVGVSGTTYTITSTAGSNGRINPSGTIQEKAGGDQVFLAAANPGYLVDQWSVDGVTVQNGDIRFKLFDISSDRRVHVTFKKDVGPGFQWLSALDGNPKVHGSKIAVDYAGNSFVIGSFYGRVIFRDTQFRSDFFPQVFVAKFDLSGSPLWIRIIGGSGAKTPGGVAVDGSGNCYVTGWFQDSADIERDILRSAGDNDIFIAKYSSAGEIAWIKQIGGSGDDSRSDVKVDNSGNCYVVGSSEKGYTIGGSDPKMTGGPGFFLVKYDASVQVAWAKSTTGPGFAFASAIALDSLGNVYLAGGLKGSVSFEERELSSTGPEADILVAKYDGLGKRLWVTTVGGTGGGKFASGVGVDAAGNVYITGVFTDGHIAFENQPVDAIGSTDIFIAKFNPDGTLNWAHGAGGVSADQAFSISVDSSGNSFIAGVFNNVVAKFEDYDLGPSEGDDVFVVKYGNSGKLVWAKKAGGGGTDSAYGTALDRAGNLYVTGGIGGRAQFGLTEYEGEFFITKLGKAEFQVTNPVIQIVRQSQGFKLSIPTKLNGRYKLDSKTALGEGVWVERNALIGDGNDWEVPTDTTGPTRFYRVRAD